MRGNPISAFFTWLFNLLFRPGSNVKTWRFDCDSWMCVGVEVGSMCVGRGVGSMCVGGEVGSMCVGGEVGSMCVGGEVGSMCVGRGVGSNASFYLFLGSTPNKLLVRNPNEKSGGRQSYVVCSFNTLQGRSPSNFFKSRVPEVRKVKNYCTSIMLLRPTQSAICLLGCFWRKNKTTVKLDVSTT